MLHLRKPSAALTVSSSALVLLAAFLLLSRGLTLPAALLSAALCHELFHTKIGVKLCSMAGGGVSRNLWNFFRTAPAGTGQAVTCSTSGMGLRLK